MTASANLSPMIGGQMVGNSGSFIEVATATSGYNPLIRLGTIIQTDTQLGVAEVIRLVIPKSTAIPFGAVVTWNSSYEAVLNPVTQYTGAPLAFSVSSVPSDVNYLQYAWFALSGLVVMLSAATISADSSVGISASTAGRGAANSNGRQILGAICRVAASQTVVKSASLRQGSTVIKVANTAGWFVGLPLSGTGIAGGTTIAAIDSDDQTVTLSANATATGYNSITGTYNNGSNAYWNTISCSRPHVQGAVTT